MDRSSNTGRNRRPVLFLLLFILIAAFIFCLLNIRKDVREYKAGQVFYSDAVSFYVQTAEPEPEQEKIRAPISVDFEALSRAFPGIQAWIYSENSPINYPVMQAEDNYTFLHMAPDGTYLYAGSIFADYRCRPLLSTPNTILFGHNMKDMSMFASIQQYSNEGYYEEHPVIWLLTPGGDYCADVIAGMLVPDNDEFFNCINDEAAVSRQVLRFMTGSLFKTDCTWVEGTRLLSLSTCANKISNTRYVLICAIRE